MDLMRADTEQKVVDLLTAAGYWDNIEYWRPYGDDENNYSTIGNQQSEAVAALVEKIVNGVDARLLDACLQNGVDAEGPDSPTSIRKAVARFVEQKATPGPSDGVIADWSDGDATAHGRLLTVAATGSKPSDGDLSLTVADQGEGQTPDKIPSTFLSLHRSNKLRIPFVQGKFNMGSTGALLFCGGKYKLQLIVTRRNPELLPANATDRDREWGFTVVRREDRGLRSTMYTYLAPLDIPNSEVRGVLSFTADSLPIFPEANAQVRDAYYRRSNYGSLVKLYEYELPGTRSNIVYSGGGLLRRIDVALPELALPVRLYECRDYGGKAGSYATNVLGLVSRLERDRGDNLEDKPIGGIITLAGKQIPLRIYVFQPGKADDYRSKSHGVVFGINGQAHGSYSVDFFRRKSVGMSYLADSLLVFADCSEIDGRMREDLFMNSRDRLRNTTLARELESTISALLKTEPTLRKLANQRRQAAVQQRLRDDKPLAEVLQGWMKTNPFLSKLLLAGMQLSAPFPPDGGGEGTETGGADKFAGRRFPTYFRFKGRKDGEPLTRSAALGSRARIDMETDAEDEYFLRQHDPGAISVKVHDGIDYADTADFASTGPRSGMFRPSVGLPAGVHAGDTVRYLIEVTDPNRWDVFRCELTLNVTPPGSERERGKPNPGNVSNTGKGSRGGGTGTLALPNVIPVHESDENWRQYGFTEDTAMVIKEAPDAERAVYDYYVNVDNKYLKIVEKESEADAPLLERQFTFGLLLVSLAIIQDSLRSPDGTEEDREDIEAIVARVTKAIAPVLIPMIQTIGQLSADDS